MATGEIWKTAISKAPAQFENTELLPEQEKAIQMSAISSFFTEKDFHAASAICL